MQHSGVAAISPICPGPQPMGALDPRECGLDSWAKWGAKSARHLVARSVTTRAQKS